MKTIKKIDRWLGMVEKSILVILLSLMVLLSFLQVVLRQFFSSGILWADTFLRHLVLWVGFLGAAVATQENSHFAIDVVKKMLPDRLKKMTEWITDIFALLCLTFLCMAALKFFQYEYETKSVLFSIGNFEFMAYWMDLILPMGFILIWIHFAFKTVEDVVGRE